MKIKHTVLMVVFGVSMAMTLLIYVPSMHFGSQQTANYAKKTSARLEHARLRSKFHFTSNEDSASISTKDKPHIHQRLALDIRPEWNRKQNDRVIRILTWTNRSLNNPFWFSRKLEGRANCGTPIPCQYSNNHSLYDVSDVIIFHVRLAFKKYTLPKYRLPHQHWVTYLRETPSRIPAVKNPYNTWFNWTIAYTKNADIVRPYGMCVPRREKVKRDPSSITDTIRRVYRETADLTPWIRTGKPYIHIPVNHAEGRTGLVLWAVGNCKTPSKREHYVAELKRYIKVDIVGACVHDVCDKRRAANCSQIWYRGDLFVHHKFYLSFENSLCHEYVTEKVWTRLERGIVPVVLGNADYKAILPERSYIDVKDFASPKDLAAYLHKLDQNDTLYNEYFAWKRDYTCHVDIPGNSLFCDICRFMNTNRNNVKIVEDANTFWNTKNCISPEEYYNGGGFMNSIDPDMWK